MIIKAVFFDFFNTLVCYHPSREQIYVDMCSKHGINIELKAIAQSLPAADKFWRDEERRSPVGKRTTEDKLAFYSEYITRIFTGAGIQIDQELALKILLKMREMSWDFKTYDDTLTTLKLLKERGLILGLISNVGQDMNKTFEKLGIKKYLDFHVTSFEIGFDKPRPEIFQAALDKSQIKPEEAIYVGDQYDQDVVGARGVGMKAILVDRNNWFSDITNCPRIQNLESIVEYL